MAALLAISTVVNLVLSAAAVLCLRRMIRWANRSLDHLRARRETLQELAEAQQQLYHTVTKLSLTEAALKLALSDLFSERRVKKDADSGFLLDDKTASLVRLAISNSEEHEQHAAAMLVCRRLMERILLK